MYSIEEKTITKKNEETIQIDNSIIYRVLVIQNTNQDYFDYISDKNIPIGQIVIVPFGNKKLFGMIYELPKESYEGLKKSIIEILPWYFKEEIINFIEKFSNYHLIKSNIILKKFLNKLPKKIQLPVKNSFEINLNTLSEEQNDIYNKIKNKIDRFQVSLIFGITGSGKTEIYFHLIKDILNEGGQVLFLLPEIGIVSGMEDRVKERLNIDPILWFSGAKTTNGWQKVYNGDNLVVLGARSGLFLPFKNLKLIIVDEEQDNSYKDPIYHGRNMAILLGQIWKCNVILGSATPSTESYYRAIEGHYDLYYLKNRYGQSLLPKVKLIQDNICLISKVCLQEIERVLEDGKQVLIYLNKRGFSASLECNSCGQKQKCNNCDQLLVLHQFKKIVLCHLCGKKYENNICVICGEIGIISRGYGVERLETFIYKHFPQYKIGIFSSDFCDSVKKIEQFIEKIKNKELQIIIGTQITAKGHNFPELSLVVIINTALQSGDFRGREILLQNLLQVSGRAGRYGGNSLVLVQSNDLNISHWLKESAYEDFLKFSIEERKKWDLPPFSKLALIPGEHSKLEVLEKKMEEIFHILSNFIKKNNLDIHIFPPTNNPISRIKNKYRMFILIKTHKTSFQVLKNILKKYKFIIEINPYEFY